MILSSMNDPVMGSRWSACDQSTARWLASERGGETSVENLAEQIPWLERDVSPGHIL